MARLTLRQFQHLFTESSVRAEESSIHPLLLKEIVPGGSLSAKAALDVYRTGHIVRLTEALGETFEAVWWVAGDTHFFRLQRTLSSLIILIPTTFQISGKPSQPFSHNLPPSRISRFWVT